MDTVRTEEWIKSSGKWWCIASREGCFSDVDNAFCDALGFSADHLRSNRISSFFHPDDIQFFPSDDFYARFLKADESYIWLFWSSHYMENATRYVSIREISDAERASLSERRCHALLQSGSDLICIVNKEGFITYASPNLHKGGFSSRRLSGRSILDLIHPDDVVQAKEALHSVLQVGYTSVPVLKIKNEDGTCRFIQAELTNKVSDPAIGGIICNARDITSNLICEKERNSVILRTKNLIENLSSGFLLLDSRLAVIHCNSKATQLLAMESSDLKGRFIAKIFINLRNRAIYNRYKKALLNDGSAHFEEYLSFLQKWYRVSVYRDQNEINIFFDDITEAKVQKFNLKLEKNILEMNARSGNSLKKVVDHYLEGLFQIYPWMKCSLQLLKAERLFLVSCPSLPFLETAEFTKGIKIAPHSFLGGAAAYFKESFIIRDIARHPNTRVFKDIAAEHQLYSCWSIPLFDENRKVIAALTVYYNEVKEPTEVEKDLVKRVVAFLQVIVASHGTKENLQLINERHKLVTLASRDAIYDWDIVTNELYWGEGFEKIFGYKEALTTINWWEGLVHPEDIEEVISSLNMVLDDLSKRYWHAEYRFLRADKSYAYIVEDGYIIRDELGKPLRMVGAMHDHTKVYEHQYQVLKQNNALREIAQINSHHIRKPLANILGLISTIKDAGQNELEELMCLLEESSIELDAITRQIAKKTYD